MNGDKLAKEALVILRDKITSKKPDIDGFTAQVVDPAMGKLHYSEDIKEPCPFCGDSAVFIEVLQPIKRKYYAVKCQTCDGSGGCYNSIEDAVENWNTRHYAKTTPNPSESPAE